MIFVTVGTQKFQFDRLFKELDLLIEKKVIKEEVFAQIGYTSYVPKHFKYSQLITEDEMNNYVAQASLVITHSGTSSIIKSLKHDKKVLVVPRMSKFKEHVDDHQLELAHVFEEKNVVEVVYDIKDLAHKMEICRTKQYDEISLDNSRLLQSIGDYIDELIKQ